MSYQKDGECIHCKPLHSFCRACCDMEDRALEEMNPKPPFIVDQNEIRIYGLTLEQVYLLKVYYMKNTGDTALTDLENI